jgi:hypothetical protein
MSTKLKLFFSLIGICAVFAIGYFIGLGKAQSHSDKELRNDAAPWFSNINDAKSWVAKNYTEKKFTEKKLPSFTLHSLYGSTGSGIQRVDSYFLACNNNECSLLGTKQHTRSEKMLGEAEITTNNGELIIESKNNFKFVFEIEK